MTCANPDCGTQTLYLRSGALYDVDFLGGTETGECQNIQRRVIWLCDACSGVFAVETWRPPGEQLRPSGSPRIALPRAAAGTDSAEGWY